VSGSPESAIAEAMNRLWEKYLPQIEERIATLQHTAERLAVGDLTPNDRQKAAAEAHKLAGVLGTFGLNEGTNLAREAESLYEGSSQDIGPFSARLSAIAAQLQMMIAGRK
jgi:HPt (histidine-containing phosphotransfer) domain-containing protein